METIEKKLQDALPGVKIVTVKRTAETEFEILARIRQTRRRERRKTRMPHLLKSAYLTWASSHYSKWELLMKVQSS